MPRITDDKLAVVIGKNLRRMRLAKGINQVDMAKLMGISWHQLSRYENGHNVFSLTAAMKFAKILGVKEKDFSQFYREDV